MYIRIADLFSFQFPILRLNIERASNFDTYNVIWGNPTYPGENAQCLEYVSREEVPNNRRSKCICKETLAAHSSAVSYTSIRLRMQRIEKGAVHQIRRPYWNFAFIRLKKILITEGLAHRWRLDQETTSNTSDRESDKLRRHHYHPLICIWGQTTATLADCQSYIWNYNLGCSRLVELL